MASLPQLLFFHLRPENLGAHAMVEMEANQDLISVDGQGHRCLKIGLNPMSSLAKSLSLELHFVVETSSTTFLTI